MKRFVTYLLTLCLLLTVATPVVAAAEETYWYDGATVTQKMGTITFDGTKATFSCDVPNSEGGNLGINIPVSAPNKEINVEFKFRMEGAWTTRENVVIYTGSHRAYIGFRTNGITCQDKTGTATVIPCTTGNTENLYAVQINNAGVANFYCNGKSIMKDWQLPTNSGKAAINISNYGGNGGTLSKFTISDVKWSVPQSSGATTVTSGDPPSLTTPPEPFFYDFTEEEDLTEWRLASDSVWIDTDKGVLAMDHPLSNSTAAFVRLTFADDFIIEHRMRFQIFGDKFYYKVHYPGGVFYIDIREQRIHTEEVSGDLLPEGFLFDPENPDEWHTMKFVSYGGKKYVKVYIDDELIGDYPTQPHTREYYHLQIGAQGVNGTHAAMEYDWIRYTPVWSGDASLAAPLSGDEYLEGEPINLAAYLAEGVETDKVDYKLNGVVVATGTKENNYKAVLTGIPAGAYTMVVSCNGKDSSPSEFSVRPARDNAIITTRTGENQVEASLAYYDELPSVKSVEYLVNGVLAGSSNQAPFPATLPVSGTEGTTIVALCKDGNGAVLEKLTGSVTPDLSTGNTTHYANEISYDVVGAGGNVAVDISNGVFQLKLIHQADKLTYQTSEGEKSIGAGAGKYTILTDGPFADLYYGGKLAASFRMPLTTEVNRSVSENGMTVKNLNISITEGRQNHLVARNVSDKQKTYALPDLNDKYYYNLDFMASKEDQVKLTMNDSIFSAQIEFRDGKIYCRTSKSLDSEAYEYKLADVLEGETHYRLSSELGMSNLYANGKVIGSFRNVRAVGEATLGVNVTAGELSYLSVNDFKDIYLYEDDFSGAGISDSDDYWYYSKGMTGYIDTSRKEMVLIAKDKTEAIAENLAYAGDLNMAADVTVSQAGEKGGLWMSLNHATDGTYAKAGYNFETREFEIVDRQETAASITKASIPYDLPLGQSVRMEIKTEKQLKDGVTNDKKVTLYVNGTPILTKDVMDVAGKSGFMATDCVAYVKNFSYRGDAKPMLDVRDAVGAGDSTGGAGNTTGFFKSGDAVYSVQQTVAASTTDYGESWKSVDMQGLGYPKFSAHMLKLNSGELLSLYKNEGVNAWGEDYYNDNNQKLYQMQFYLSPSGEGIDDWEKAGILYGEGPEHGENLYGNTVGALAQSPDGPNGKPGRIFFVGDNDLSSENYGDTKMWYSDDKGMTWKLGLHITFESQGNSCMQEPQPVATKDWVRIYYRNDRGMIRYFESLDNGETWDTESKSTPFFMALNCFGMDIHRYYDENGEMQEDIYVAWSNDSQNLGSRYQFLRTNWSLAKSEDYGDSWEFLGTPWRVSSVYTGQMNLGLYFIDDYAFINGYAVPISNGTGGSKARPIATPVTKQVPSMRIQQVKPLYHSQVSMFEAVRDHQVDRMLILDAETGTILLRGMRMENAAIENGVAATYAAAFAGASLRDKEDGTVILTCGDSAVTLNVTEKNGVKYIPADTFAEKFGLKLTDVDGVKVISTYDDWTWRGEDAIWNAMRLF